MHTLYILLSSIPFSLQEPFLFLPLQPRKMGYFFEEKALENYNQSLHSLEEKISKFLIEDSAAEHDDHTIEENCEDDDALDISGGSIDLTERTGYWESQENMLREILSHNSLTVSKIRREVKQIMEIRARDTTLCCCCSTKPSSDYCAYCLRRAVVNQLCDKGFNAALCTSMWKPTKKCPGGRHEYIDVIIDGASRKKPTRYLIELEFQAEFEMAKACNEYRKLTNQLPKYYVGKPENLNEIVRTVCDAAKRSTREMKIHMGPWRKRRFMQMKWSSAPRDQQRCPSDHEQSSHQPLLTSRQIHQMPIYRTCLQFSTAKVVQVT